MGDRDRQWSPSAGLVVVGWVGALAAAAWCVQLWVSYSDPVGRLLAGTLAVGLTVAAAFGTRARPRLRVDADGLTVGGFRRARHYPWPLVGDVRVLERHRFGLSNALLEVDTATADGEERLLVFGRLDLAADPHDVAPQLLALRPTRGPA
jgi:hypothetical protein